MMRTLIFLLLGIPTTCHGKEGSYIGCYFDDAQRDIKNGPMKYGYNQQTCNSACQDYTQALLLGSRSPINTKRLPP